MGKGYVTNCYIDAKYDKDGVIETLFEMDEDGNCFAFLDGYAIIPKEKHEEVEE